MAARSAATGWKATTGMPCARSLATSRASESRAMWRIAVLGTEPGRPAGRRHRCADQHEVGALRADEVGIRRRVDATVDVATPADLGRLEVGGHGARRPRRLGDGRRRRSVAAEHDAPSGVEVDGDDPRRRRPRVAEQRLERGGDVCRRDPALRQHRRRQRSRAHLPRCAQRPRQQRRRSHRPGRRPPSCLPRRRAEAGTAHDRSTFGRQWLAEGTVGQVGGRHAGAEHRDDDRAGGRADEQVGPASVPAELAVERGEHSGVEGVSHGPTGSEHDGDSRGCHADSLPATDEIEAAGGPPVDDHRNGTTDRRRRSLRRARRRPDRLDRHSPDPRDRRAVLADHRPAGRTPARHAAHRRCGTRAGCTSAPATTSARRATSSSTVASS